MSGAPGWYPDPGGQPDRYRYWDGSTWSTATTGDPRRSAPETMSQPGAQTTQTTQTPQTTPGTTAGTAARASEQRRPHAARWLIAVTVAAVLVAAGSIALRILDKPSTPPVLFPSSTTSTDDDNSPTPSSRPRASTPSPLPRAIGCPEGAPDARAPHPVDERVHGGNLSFPRVDTFVPETAEIRMTFAYDVVQQVRTVSLDPPWIAQLALGRLIADGYPRTAQHTAELVTECIVASGMYQQYKPQRRDIDSRPITVSGREGWLITTDIMVSVAGLPFRGDHVAVAVVPDGADWGLFFGAVPIGDDTLTQTLTDTVLALRVN